MKTLLPCVIACVLSGAGAVSFAQAPRSQQTPSQQQQAPPSAQQDEGTPMTVRGCLSKGDQPQVYSIADEKTGQKIAFSASPKLDSYVNQNVELTGQIVERGGVKAFLPQTVKSLAASCGAPGGK